MNWSVYSKFVGNVFGAPLAVEGLAAFALESTFLGPLGSSRSQWASASSTAALASGPA